jgi:hypothetical protein
MTAPTAEAARLTWRIRQLAHQLDQLRVGWRQLAAMRSSLERLKRKCRAAR